MWPTDEDAPHVRRHQPTSRLLRNFGQLKRLGRVLRQIEVDVIHELCGQRVPVLQLARHLVRNTSVQLKLEMLYQDKSSSAYSELFVGVFLLEVVRQVEGDGVGFHTRHDSFLFVRPRGGRMTDPEVVAEEDAVRFRQFVHRR